MVQIPPPLPKSRCEVTTAKDNYGCILHVGCGGVVAPNLGVLTAEELMEQTVDFLSCGLMCFKCGEEVQAGELEIEKDDS